MLQVLRPLTGLSRLTLIGGTLQEADVQLLATEYGQLTYLGFEGSAIELEGARVGRRACTPLPAALRELHLKCWEGRGVWPRTLLALQLPPGLTRLGVEGLTASFKTYTVASGGNGAGGGVPGAGNGMGQGGGGGGAAPPASPPSPCPGFDELLEAVALLYGRLDGSKGLALRHEWEPSPLTWPAAGDGHVRLFAALRPLRLRRLKLKGCVVGLMDVAALAEQLPELEVGGRGL